MTGSQFFPYEFDDRFKFIWWPLGARPGTDGVTLADGTFTATFGRLRVETPIDNIDERHITRDYQWWKAIGVRLSMADDGLTFGTNPRAGLCVHFAERVPRVVGFKPHSALTVTVADPDALEAALAQP